MSRADYEIRTVGDVPMRVLDDFEGVTVTVDPVGSNIRVDQADEARFHGLLNALCREGFILVEVSRVSNNNFTPPHARMVMSSRTNTEAKDEDPQGQVRGAEVGKTTDVSPEGHAPRAPARA